LYWIPISTMEYPNLLPETHVPWQKDQHSRNKIVTCEYPQETDVVRSYSPFEEPLLSIDLFLAPAPDLSQFYLGIRSPMYQIVQQQPVGCDWAASPLLNLPEYFSSVKPHDL